MAAEIICIFKPLLVDIGKVSISQSTAISLSSEESFSLTCSVDMSPDPLPDNISYPLFEWTIQNNSTSLVNYSENFSNTTKDGSTYSSTLWMLETLESNYTIYKCIVMGNTRLSASILISTCNRLNMCIPYTKPLKFVFFSPPPGQQLCTSSCRKKLYTNM